MQFVDVFGTLGWENCVGAAIDALIKTANKSVSRLHNVNYSMTLSVEDLMEVKNIYLCWVCKDKFVEGSGEMSVRDHDHLCNPFLSGWSIFRMVAHKYCNFSVNQQYFLQVYMHNSNYELKFILPRWRVCTKVKL